MGWRFETGAPTSCQNSMRVAEFPAEFDNAAFANGGEVDSDPCQSLISQPIAVSARPAEFAGLSIEARSRHLAAEIGGCTSRS